MEFRNLMTFLRVAGLNSFTAAADALGYSQSTVSFQIKQLEQELGCLLFERFNHSVFLTEDGKRLLEYAQNVHRLTDEFKQSMNPDQEPRGFIHIVTPDSVCESMISDNYIDFATRYPGIALKLSTADTEDMFRMLDRNEADIVHVLDSHVYKREYIIAKEERAGMHFIVRGDDPLAKRKGLSIRDILHRPFILTEKQMGYRRVLDKFLARMSIEVQPALELGRTDLIAAVVEKGEFVSFLPDFVTEERVARGSLAYLDVVDVEVDIWKQLIYHSNKWISKELRIFLEYVMENDFKE